MKRLSLAVCALFALLFISGCTRAPKRYQAIYSDVFDTVTEFTAYCSSQEEFNNYSKIIHDELLRCHNIFDVYSADSEAAQLNSSCGEPFEASDDLLTLITSAKSWHSATGGQLNAAMGSVLRLWHECSEHEVLPDFNELSRKGEHCDIESVKISGKSIVLTDTEVSFDFGALAKGYAAQLAADLVTENGCKSFALSVGGNVITKGKKPSGKWQIGIEAPDGGLLTTLEISDKAVVTSGDYQRYFEVDGVKYHHIIDPKTLCPADLWRSVTVICDSSADADALSTALFCMPLDEGKELLKASGAEALWLDVNGAVTRSEGFSDYEK